MIPPLGKCCPTQDKLRRRHKHLHVYIHMCAKLCVNSRVRLGSQFPIAKIRWNFSTTEAGNSVVCCSDLNKIPAEIQLVFVAKSNNIPASVVIKFIDFLDTVLSILKPWSQSKTLESMDEGVILQRDLIRHCRYVFQPEYYNKGVLIPLAPLESFDTGGRRCRKSAGMRFGRVSGWDPNLFIIAFNNI